MNMRILGIVFFMSTAALAQPSLLKIEHETSGMPVRIYSLDEPTIESQVVDPALVFNSELVLKVTGVLEGNICDYDNVSLMKKYRRSSVYPNTAQDLIFTGLVSRAAQRMSNMACASVSVSRPFEVKLNFSPTSWGSAQTMTWDNYMEVGPLGASPAIKRISVTLHRTQGWSFTVSDVAP